MCFKFCDKILECLIRIYNFCTFYSLRENNDWPIAVVCFDRMLQSKSELLFLPWVHQQCKNHVLLHTVVTVICDTTVLQTYMYVVTVLLLFLCGDIEMNPGKTIKVWPNCNIHYNIRKKSCECGYVFCKKPSRRMGSTRTAGFSVSSGRPASNVDIELHVPNGHCNRTVWK